MIARMWHGAVPRDKSEEYHQYLLDTGLKDYEKVEGNRGAFLLKTDDEKITHYYTLTFWDDIEAIKCFAGEDFENARYYPADKDFLLECEPTVKHFDVLEMPAYLNQIHK